MKEDVNRIIEDLYSASRQSLFNGVVVIAECDSNPRLAFRDSDRPGNKRQCTEVTRSSMKKRTWDEILAEASDLLPFMTNHEHGQVSRLAGILLLGFFLPQSTGNVFFSSQNLSTQPRSVSSRYQHQKRHFQSTGAQTTETQNDVQNKNERYVSISLEERLENTAHRYGNEFGEIDDLIVHGHLENSFQSFLKNGLRPFLLGRPAHATDVDLLHILAMAIHPRPSDQCIRQTTSRLEEQNSDIWEMTTRLMSNLVPNSFNINYHHRVQLVQIVLDCLVLPECQQKAGICQNAPLFEGAIPHLRAALYAFGMASTRLYDSHLAQRAMVSLAIQGGIDHVVKEEWSRLLHRLVDDQTNYNKCSKNSTKVGRINDENFCPHTSRGSLLREFLIKCNGARRYADEEFLQYALGSLTDAIEMQLDCWTKEERESEDPDNENTKQDNSEEGDGEPSSSNQPTLVLASLLAAAKNLFHFLLPLKSNSPGDRNSDGEDEEMEESDDSHYRDMLISCCIQLVHHWDPVIVQEACTLLVLAFSYAEDMWEDYVGAVFDSIVIAIDLAIKKDENHGSSVVPIEGLVSAFSQHSLSFAVNLSRLLLKEKWAGTNPPVAFRLIAAISNARPAIAHQHRGVLTNHLDEIEDSNTRKHILASVLSCRRTHYFANKEDSLTNLRPLLSVSSVGNWNGYLLSRHAIVTGNFDVAKRLYEELINFASSEASFVWLSAMGMVADGEGSLCRDGAKALLESTSKLRIAISALRSMRALNQASTSFQIRFLELRVDFLDLLTNVRQLTAEMRLVGAEPKKFTRSNLHLKSIFKLLHRVGIDYMQLYRKYGLFLCQQSRSVLRTLHSLCSFVTKAVASVFLESIDKEKVLRKLVDGDIAQPLTSLLKQLDSFALDKVDQYVDTKIRAVTLLEIIDGILKAPVPIPRSLTCTTDLPYASLQVHCDPDVHGNENNRLQISMGSPIVCLACGTVPAALQQRSKVPFNILLLWYTFYPKGSSKKETASKPPQKIEGGPFSTSMSSSGSFFVKVKSQALSSEGCYDLKFRLGCRDIRGGDWELPSTQHVPCFSVKVLHSETK